jgi:membrane protein insertase Oxa1/YidC/SpoIIIJ
MQSQATYNAIVASTSVFTSISTAITVVLYLWQVILATMLVKAMSGFGWIKSLAAAGGSVILTIIILGLLASIGLI